MHMLRELGLGSVDDAILVDILKRASRPATQPAANWQLSETVRALYYEPKNKPFLKPDPSLPEGAQEMIDAAPRIAKAARWLIVDFCPCHDPRYPTDGSVMGGCYGCKTDNIEDFGRIYSSKMDATGCIEGIVSSLANWKLYALGLKHYEWTNELINTRPDEQFAHPLRPTEPVPAGTVIHTVFCSLHVAEWYAALAKTRGEEARIVHRAAVVASRIQRALPQLEALKKQATPVGVELLSGMLEWGYGQER